MTATVDLLRALLARGISQSEIRRRTGIPQPRLSKWAAGKAPSGADDALKLKSLSDELGPVEGRPCIDVMGPTTEARDAT